MGFLSNRVAKESLVPGDHIYSWRTAYAYAHHGIYVGDNTVIHFTQRGQEVGTKTALGVLLTSSSLPRYTLICPDCPPLPAGDGDNVLSSCLSCFLSGGTLCLFKYAVGATHFLATRGGTCTQASSDPAEIVVHRAKFLLKNGFGCYNMLSNNCENFAIYCKTELVVVNCETAGGSGQATSILGVPIATVLTIPFRIFSTNVYGMAARAAYMYYSTKYGADVGIRKDVKRVSVEVWTLKLAAATAPAPASESLHNVAQ